jgi:hypothetical protein
MRKSFVSINAVVTIVLVGLLAGAAFAQDTGTLTFRANGEDFVRQGFTSKDGWAITFERVLISLGEIRAYQTNPPYDPDSGELTRSGAMVGLARRYVVDLAAGEADAEPITIGTVADAPSGYYNAASWALVPTGDGDLADHTLLIEGSAAKEGAAVAFVLRFDTQDRYTCGAFIGDERKGVLAAGTDGEIELTFHFDHIFGDGDLPADDSLNTLAPGFAPFAALAVDGALDVTLAELESALMPDDYQILIDILPTLGHTGEGHCYAS